MAKIKIISVIRLQDKSSSGGGGGLMRGIKIPQQDFALRMSGGLMHEGGGGGGGYLWDTTGILSQSKTVGVNTA